jgi:sn-glycerol 3-phosphate transport system permease protein
VTYFAKMRHVNAWLFLLPAMALIVAFTHVPAVNTFINSFFLDGRGGMPAEFVGLENFRYLLEDEVFLKVLRNNLLFASGTIPLSISLAMVMALLVNAKLPGQAWLRLSYFVPTVLPMIAVANIWLFFFTPEYGLLEQVRSFLGFSGVNWLGSESTALICIIAVAVWKDAGFFMIFYLAALQQVPPSLGEAAMLEGASRFCYYRRIVFPLLMPTTLFVLVNATINAFRMVDHLFVLTQGGPNNASSLLLYYIYEVSFKYWDTGYGATLTLVLLGFLGLASIIQFGVIEKRVHYR